MVKLMPVVCLHTGKVLHSHSYRCAESFSGQSVVVLGANASGLDISIELAKVGAQVKKIYIYIGRATAQVKNMSQIIVLLLLFMFTGSSGQIY